MKSLRFGWRSIRTFEPSSTRSAQVAFLYTGLLSTERMSAGIAEGIGAAAVIAATVVAIVMHAAAAIAWACAAILEPSYRVPGVRAWRKRPNAERDSPMNPFDYLNVLISIILGLAIAKVLTGLATVITARERVDFYWPPIVWAIWIFFITAQHWWAQWGLQFTKRWTFLDFALLLLVPVCLFLLSALVLPEREEDGKLDLGEWFYRNRAWFFGIMFFLPGLSILEEIVRSGYVTSRLNFAFLLAFEVVIGIAFFLKSRKAQEWLCGQAMVMTLVYIVLLFINLEPAR